MNLRDKIKNDLKDAMKSGDNITRGVLRLLNSDIKNEEIDQKRELEDGVIVEIIKRNVKRRKDSIKQYKKGNRADLADKEKKELVILEKYMPEQMGEEEIRSIVKKVISELKVVGASEFGRVMGAVMKEFGSKADGNVVSRIVKEELK
jgi:uncharacterized protein YqeY